MNNVNPLYVIALLFMVLFMSMFQLSNAKTELENMKKSYYETESLATELVALKNAYGNKIKIKKSLQSILRHPSLKGLNKKFKNSSLTISSNDMGAGSLNFLMSKVLNSSYNITQLNIKRLSSSKVSFKMEIQW